MEPLVVTLWRTFSRGRRSEYHWDEFVRFVETPEVVQRKKDVAGFSLASFDENRRALARVEHVFGLVLDLDHGDPTLERTARAFPGTLGIVYTTFSHEPSAPRLRAVFPYSRPVTTAEHDRIWAWSAAACARAKLELDPAARDASHLFFLPSRRPGAEYRWLKLKGEPLNVERALKEAKTLPPPRAVPYTRPGDGPQGGSVNGTARGGGRRDSTNSGRDWQLALRLMREGASDAEVADELRNVSAKYAARGGENYILRTVENARASYDSRTPVMRVQSAGLYCLPPRFSHAERRHVELGLVGGFDGFAGLAGMDVAKAQIVVPAPWYPEAASTWAACFPDVDPEPLLAPWDEVRESWEKIRWKHRRFEVATREGEVRWIRAAGLG